MEKFKVGDTVQVVNPGNTYSTYDRMFKKMGFKDTRKNDEFAEGQCAEVFAIGDHETNGCTLLGLQAPNGSQCLISTNGVVKVITQPTSDQQFDIIRQFCDDLLQSQEITDKEIFKYLLKKVASY
jgi:hypothetical protein